MIRRSVRQERLDFQLESTSDTITSRAGLALFQEAALVLGVRKCIRENLPGPGSNRGFRPQEFVTTAGRTGETTARRPGRGWRIPEIHVPGYSQLDYCAKTRYHRVSDWFRDASGHVPRSTGYAAQTRGSTRQKGAADLSRAAAGRADGRAAIRNEPWDAVSCRVTR